MNMNQRFVLLLLYSILLEHGVANECADDHQALHESRRYGSTLDRKPNPCLSLWCAQDMTVIGHSNSPIQAQSLPTSTRTLEALIDGFGL